MPTESIQAIGQIIELSLAPAFLLVALGSFINVATLRLGRVVDRARFLEAQLNDPAADADQSRHIDELKFLSTRMASSNLAIVFATFAALMASLVVATLFVSAIVRFDASFILALAFILTMILLVTALGFFLAEILTATRSIKVRSDYIKSK